MALARTHQGFTPVTLGAWWEPEKDSRLFHAGGSQDQLRRPTCQRVIIALRRWGKKKKSSDFTEGSLILPLLATIPWDLRNEARSPLFAFLHSLFGLSSEVGFFFLRVISLWQAGHTGFVKEKIQSQARGWWRGVGKKEWERTYREGCVALYSHFQSNGKTICILLTFKVCFQHNYHAISLPPVNHFVIALGQGMDRDLDL